MSTLCLALAVLPGVQEVSESWPMCYRSFALMGFNSKYLLHLGPIVYTGNKIPCSVSIQNAQSLGKPRNQRAWLWPMLSSSYRNRSGGWEQPPACRGWGRQRVTTALPWDPRLQQVVASTTGTPGAGKHGITPGHLLASYSQDELQAITYITAGRWEADRGLYKSSTPAVSSALQRQRIKARIGWMLFPHSGAPWVSAPNVQ